MNFSVAHRWMRSRHESWRWTGAGAALDSIGPEEYETERLRKLFGEKHLLSELDAELLRQSVRQITYTGKEVKIRLKNNQWMEG